MENAPTIEQVITNTALLIAKLSPFLIGLSIAVTNYLKKFTNNSKIIAASSLVIGYVVGTLFMLVLGNKAFSPLTIIIGIFSALGAPAIYSVGKTFTPEKKDDTLS